MKLSILYGALAALITGVAIATQSTLTSRAGGILGDLKTGLLTNFIGGATAGVLILLLALRGSLKGWPIPTNALVFVSISGFLGIFIITGVSFSLQRAGVAAGLATVILGQMAFSVLADSLGLVGSPVIPLTLERVLGLIAMGAGVFLLLPRA